MAQTEFVDRSGKPIYVGDIVQYRLGLNNKHGGPVLARVVQTKKGIVSLVDPRSTENRGWPMQKNIEKSLTIFDTSGRNTQE